MWARHVPALLLLSNVVGLPREEERLSRLPGEYRPRELRAGGLGRVLWLPFLDRKLVGGTADGGRLAAEELRSRIWLQGAEAGLDWAWSRADQGTLEERRKEEAREAISLPEFVQSQELQRCKSLKRVSTALAWSTLADVGQLPSQSWRVTEAARSFC